MKKQCQFCGQLFDRSVFPDGSIERPSRYAKRKFCSRECANAHRVGKNIIETLEQAAETPVDIIMESKTPLQHLLDTMNNPNASPERRDRCAIAAAPFCHCRASDNKPGKKEQQAEAAKEATAGRFAPMAPPPKKTIIQ